MYQDWMEEISTEQRQQTRHAIAENLLLIRYQIEVAKSPYFGDPLETDMQTAGISGEELERWKSLWLPNGSEYIKVKRNLTAQVSNRSSEILMLFPALGGEKAYENVIARCASDVLSALIVPDDEWALIVCALVESFKIRGVSKW